MEPNTSSGTTLREVYERLGPRNGVAKDTHKLLTERGIKASMAGIYQTIHGRSNRREVVEAFLEAAENEVTRRREAVERTRQLAAAE